MKRVILTAFLILFAVPVLAHALLPEYVNHKYQISIRFPEGWSENSALATSALELATPGMDIVYSTEIDDVAVFLGVADSYKKAVNAGQVDTSKSKRSDWDLNAFSDDELEQLAKQAASVYGQSANTKVTSYSTYTADTGMKFLVIDADVGDGRYRIRQYWAIHDGYQYTFDYSSRKNPEAFETHLGEVEAALATISFDVESGSSLYNIVKYGLALISLAGIVYLFPYYRKIKQAKKTGQDNTETPPGNP